MKCTNCKTEVTKLDSIRVPTFDGLYIFHDTIRDICFKCVEREIWKVNAEQLVRGKADLTQHACEVLVCAPVIVGGNGHWIASDCREEMSHIDEGCAFVGLPSPRIVWLQAWVALPIEQVSEAEVISSEQPRKLCEQDGAK